MNIKITTADGNVYNIANAVSIEQKEEVEAAETEAEKPDWKEGSIFDIKKVNERYYTIRSDGEVVRATYLKSEFDDNEIKFGNACKDEDYMEIRAREIRLYNHLSNFAEVVNEGWEPDWYSHDEIKYTIKNEPITNSHQISHYRKSHPLNAVYFKSEELAQRAIDEIIIPFKRGEL